MTAVSSGKSLNHLPAVAAWMSYAESAKVINATRTHASDKERVSSMVRENVIAQLSNLKTHPSVRLALEQKKLNLHGWVYDIETGSIVALDGRTNKFVPLAEFPETTA
jgi:carbonic anhydrase